MAKLELPVFTMAVLVLPSKFLYNENMVFLGSKNFQW